MNILDTKNQLQLIKEDAEKSLLKLNKINRQIKEQEKNLLYASDVLNKKLGESLDSEKFLKFFKKPYVTQEFGKNKVLVFVPKFVKGFQVGWLYKEDETFFIYELSQYSAWLGDVPEDLLEKINFKEEIHGEIEGNRVNFLPHEKDIVKKKLGDLVYEFTEGSAKIKRGNTFEVLSKIIESGCLPFKVKPVLQSDLREKKSKIVLRDYQKKAIKKFLETGAIGLFYPTGAGKSFIAMDAIDRIRGKKLILVPGLTLAEQWKYYIEENLPDAKNEIKISTYQGYRYEQEEYVLTIYDECQRLPANTFSRLGVINTKYRIGLSASPHREDGRESYIFALTGFPVGLNWETYMQTVDKSYHQVNVHVVKYDTQKMKLIRELYDSKKRTFLFCDKIELGKKVANMLDIPFIFGETKNRMVEIEQNKSVVISRVGDLGLSVKDLEQIIEVDFLYGSRQQELQRTGRLMHSDMKNLQHNIIMTQAEFSSYGKRLWALREKGFHLKLIEN